MGTQQFLRPGVPLFKAAGVPAMDPNCCCQQCECTEAHEYPFCYHYDPVNAVPDVLKDAEVTLAFTPSKVSPYTGSCLDINGTYAIPGSEILDDAGGLCFVAYYKCQRVFVSSAFGTWRYHNSFVGMIYSGHEVQIDIRVGRQIYFSDPGAYDSGWVRQNPSPSVSYTFNPGMLPTSGWQGAVTCYNDFENTGLGANPKPYARLRHYRSANDGDTTQQWRYQNTGSCNESCNVLATYLDQPTEPYALSGVNGDSGISTGNTCNYDTGSISIDVLP